MALKVKDGTAAAQKWVQRAQAAAPDYAKGVTGSGALWQAQSNAANDTYVAGVTAAANAGRYKAGVNAAGASRYETGATVKGAQRYGPGVASAQQHWMDKTSKFLSALASLNLPPRAPRGDPRNQQRQTAVQDALHKLKISG